MSKKSEEINVEDQKCQPAPKKEFCNITIKAKLTDAELLELGNKASELNAEIGTLEIEVEKVKNEKKAAIDKLMGEISSKGSDMRGFLRCIGKKEQEKIVSAEKTYNLETKEAEYIYNGEIVYHREMEPNEKQGKFDLFDDSIPQDNETKPLECPEWLRRGVLVDWKNEKETVDGCIVNDIKVERNDKQDIIAIKVQLQGYLDYVDYTELEEIEKV